MRRAVIHGRAAARGGWCGSWRHLQIVHEGGALYAVPHGGTSSARARAAGPRARGDSCFRRRRGINAGDSPEPRQPLLEILAGALSAWRWTSACLRQGYSSANSKVDRRADLVHDACRREHAARRVACERHDARAVLIRDEHEPARRRGAEGAACAPPRSVRERPQRRRRLVERERGDGIVTAVRAVHEPAVARAAHLRARVCARVGVGVARRPVETVQRLGESAALSGSSRAPRRRSHLVDHERARAAGVERDVTRPRARRQPSSGRASRSLSAPPRRRIRSRCGRGVVALGRDEHVPRARAAPAAVRVRRPPAARRAPERRRGAPRRCAPRHAAALADRAVGADAEARLPR